MPRIHLVTDSTAHFIDPTFIARHHITVVPLTIQVGDKVFHDGVDITTAQLLQPTANGRAAPQGRAHPLPVAHAPTPEQFTAVYDELIKTGNQIISIHTSGKLSRVPHHARQGAEPFQGRCKIIVIDSLSTSVGLAALVEAAALAIERGNSLAEVVTEVRGMVPRLYTIFFVETMEYLAQAGRMGQAQAILGQMLGIKPLLTVEDGDIVPMEKVRTREQAIEKMVEFVIEFADMERVGILQDTPHPTADTRYLLEQLSLEMPNREWPILTYGPSLATLLGPGAMGVIVYERESDPEGLTTMADEDGED